MKPTYDVAVLVGSLRRDSWSRKVAHAFAAAAPAALRHEILDLRDLPMYDADLDGEAPPGRWVALRDRVRRADALLFVTPEYNRSMPAVIKNAVDVASRPFGSAAIVGKPCALVGVSPGSLGAFGAVSHLRQVVACLQMPILPGPELYLGRVDTLLDAAGAVTNAKTAEVLAKAGTAFAGWIERTAARRAG